MIAYDRNFDPPAIVLAVSVTGVVRRRPRIDSPAFIDTGADITAVPETLVNNAFKTPVYTYDVFLSLPGESAQKLEVVLTPYPFVILGRDWLQGYYLLLDGPGQQFQLSREPLHLLES